MPSGQSYRYSLCLSAKAKNQNVENRTSWYKLEGVKLWSCSQGKEARSLILIWKLKVSEAERVQSLLFRNAKFLQISERVSRCIHFKFRQKLGFEDGTPNSQNKTVSSYFVYFFVLKITEFNIFVILILSEWCAAGKAGADWDLRCYREDAVAPLLALHYISSSILLPVTTPVQNGCMWPAHRHISR